MARFVPVAAAFLLVLTAGCPSEEKAKVPPKKPVVNVPQLGKQAAPKPLWGAKIGDITVTYYVGGAIHRNGAFVARMKPDYTIENLAQKTLAHLVNDDDGAFFIFEDQVGRIGRAGDVYDAAGKPAYTIAKGEMQQIEERGPTRVAKLQGLPPRFHREAAFILLSVLPENLRLSPAAGAPSKPPAP